MAAILAQAIDGSVLEGGGQLLRNSVALSVLLGKPISIHKVRDSRKPPGLKNQHAAGIRLAAEICSAKTTGVRNGSCAVEFTPGAINAPGAYTADPGTAGSTTLLLQVSFPCLLFSNPSAGPSTLLLHGGTNASHAPQIDYSKHVFLPFLRQHFALRPKLDIRKRGYFPRGGGAVYCSIPPVTSPLPAVTLLERGAVNCIKGEAHVGGLPARIAYDMSGAAKARLAAAGVCSPANIAITAYREKDEHSVGHGGGITLWAETEGGCVIGGSALTSKRGQVPADVGIEAAEELLRNLEHGGCVDEYMQDQMIIFLALAEGTSTVRTGPLTLHTRTAIWVAEQLTDAVFEVEEHESGQATIKCTGIGHMSSHAEIPPEESDSDTAF
ncbi:hypothetical protein PLICRDRAFT_40546 [Plicaturopsis crispa FD-325 SS-3]|nr:hypothetical protein PLICRDRAFT_40546 [Plicaturopsis crispa FD-325 SS-3]